MKVWKCNSWQPAETGMEGNVQLNIGKSREACLCNFSGENNFIT